MDYIVNNARVSIGSNELTIDAAVWNSEDVKNEIENVSFKTEVTQDLVLKEFFEEKLKKVFQYQEPYKIKYFQKAEDTLTLANTKIHRILVDKEELKEELKELQEEREMVLDEYNSIHDGDDVDDPDDLEDEYRDDLDDDERNSLDDLADDIRDIDSQIYEIETLLSEPMDFEIGEQPFSTFSMESESIIDNVLATVPLGILISYFKVFLKSSNLSYKYKFADFMVPLTLEFSGCSFDEGSLNMDVMADCYQLLKRFAYDLYKEIPGDGIDKTN